MVATNFATRYIKPNYLLTKVIISQRLQSAYQCPLCFPAGLPVSRENVIQSAFKKIFCSSLIWAFLSVSTSLPRDDSLSMLIIQLMRSSLGNTGPGLSYTPLRMKKRIWESKQLWLHGNPILHTS